MSGRLNCYVTRVSLLLITAALIAGMAGCVPTQYSLSISSTAGGSVSDPGEGTFTYDQGTVVSLVADADQGYQFANWTGDVETIRNINTATTTITMNDDYSITANFAIATEIWDWYDLDAIRDNLAGNYTLMTDLDSTTPGYEELASPTANGGKGWQPIGSYDAPFNGRFDGRGYEIQNMCIKRPDENRVGLFGDVEQSGVIKNIGVTNATVIGQHEVGGLVAENNLGAVTDSYFAGSVTGEWSVGGLVGGNQGTVTNSHSAGSVIGGNWVGGLVGTNVGSLSSCHSSSSVTGDFAFVGGLVGLTGEGTVTDSYSTGSVTGNSSVGGLVGAANGYGAPGIVSNSYSTGSVTGESYVGGLLGVNSLESLVSNCYSTGSVAGNSSVGGLVGFNSEGIVSNSFWDVETSGQSTSDGGTGKNTTGMQDVATFSSAGWNIVAVAGSSERNPSYIWNIVDDVTYPFLSWQAI